MYNIRYFKELFGSTFNNLEFDNLESVNLEFDNLESVNLVPKAFGMESWNKIYTS